MSLCPFDLPVNAFFDFQKSSCEGLEGKKSNYNSGAIKPV